MAEHPTHRCTLVPLEGGEPRHFTRAATIGRHRDNDLVIDDPTVSSRHAVLEWRDGSWRVRDLASRNGTSVNRRRVTVWQALADGDEILLGTHSAWRVQLHPVEDSTPPGHDGDWTLTTLGGGTDALVLHLRWDGPEDGIIEVHQDDACWSTRAGLPFVLLDLLAARPGHWFSDGDLAGRLWGQRATRLTPSSLYTLLYRTRRIFRGWGLSDRILEKERGRLRLCLRPDQVIRGAE